MVVNLSYNLDLAHLTMLAELPALECLHISGHDLSGLLGDGVTEVLERMPRLLLLEVKDPPSPGTFNFVTPHCHGPYMPRPAVCIIILTHYLLQCTRADPSEIS